MKHLKDISRPHGILAVPKLNRVYISATGVNELQVLDEASMKIIARVPAGDYPDGIAYDPNTNRVFVSDEHGGTVTVVNAQDNKVAATIPLGGEVGNTQFDPVSKHIFSAVQTTNELVEIDPVSMKIVSRQALGDCKGAHGFTIEPETHYAFVTGEENDSYVVVDLDTKIIVDSGKVGSGPDVLAYDRQYHLLYVSAESGVVSIFSVRKNAIRKLAQGLLAPHAHTVAVDQATHKVYFPIEDINGKPVLRIMEPVLSKVPTK
jgi:YVTN family beta-propeller protein